MVKNSGIECDLCAVKAACFFAGLRGTPRFQEFRDSRVTNLYRKRQVVFYEGNQPHGVFLVCTGRVKVYKSDGRGHQLTVRVAGPGEIIGHDALLAGESYAATAEALEESRLAHVDETRFRAMLGQNPDLSKVMFRRLAGELRAAEDKARDMATKSSRERLAGELLTVRAAAPAAAKDQAPVKMPYTRQDLGELAGLAQETVIRILTELEERKVIAMNGREFRIVDRQALERMAGAAA